MKKIFKHYENLMKNIDVPEERRPFSESNAKWFLRSGAMLYRTHNDCKEAIETAKTLLRSNFPPY